MKILPSRLRSHIQRKLKFLSAFKLFLTLIVFVVTTQFMLLNVIVGQGLTNEDYVGFFKVRVYKNQMFTDPLGTWQAIGLHDATHDFYIGFLNRLFGENYTMYLYTNIFFKTIATLLLYPLIFLLTKNKLFAFLTSLLYGISYSSVGALYLYVVGNEYLGEALMLFFLIIYYFSIKKSRPIFLLILASVVTLAYLASPTRIFPVFIIILLIEMVILFKSHFSGLLTSFARLAAVFIPVIFITIPSLGAYGGDAYNLAGWPDFLNKIINGNWYLLLNPLWGLGYTFLPAADLRFLGVINFSNFDNYLRSIMQIPFLVAVIVSLILSRFISPKPKTFMLRILLINFCFDVLLFFLYTHHFNIPKNLIREYTESAFMAGLYVGIFATFIFSVALTCGIEWYERGKKNNLLLFTAISPFIALLFILGQWIFTRDYYMYQEGIHRYFVLPAIGSSLFLSSLLTLFYQQAKEKHKIMMSFVLIFIIIQIFNISQAEITQLFQGKKSSGQHLQIQESMKTQAINYIPKDKLSEDLFIYVKFASDKLEDPNDWEDTFDWRNLTYWLPIKKSFITNSSIDGCIALTWDFKELQKMTTIKSGKKGFLYIEPGHNEMRCYRNGIQYSLVGKFVSLDNLYVFSVDKSNVIDRTKEIKEKLIFNTPINSN